MTLIDQLKAIQEIMDAGAEGVWLRAHCDLRNSLPAIITNLERGEASLRASQERENRVTAERDAAIREHVEQSRLAGELTHEVIQLREDIINLKAQNKEDRVHDFASIRQELMESQEREAGLRGGS